MTWNYPFGKKRRLRGKSSNAGLTLIESLVAVAVIGITAASVGPVILVSTATRIQSQRAEQALQIAQGEVDRVRQIVEQGFVADAGGSREYTAADLSIASTPTGITKSVDAAAPTGPPAAAFNPTDYQVARQIDIDGDGTFDFAVQAYRLGDAEFSDGTRPVAFPMGVRVYEHDAVNGGGTLATTPARLGTAAGLGERDEKPLAVLYTEIVKSDERQSLCDYFEYQGSTSSTLDCS
ncbi:prepilin-type N-terminal cleavage/methylation domain-containing protein [Leptothoe sp. PORK10 BA2]|uniref:prepilin-type N-terminal cleavage/methylation domain-containing protein n=1 Tax=Leptothoe sp. PORK10 BA2 TaxID=3110254 RepID=UPI002B207148|nr:prepilin-type N-terminal cleavage/methylation domain-containing protein [Leptothoe sp. PORK10 BA2]MEA5466005.1 prepilin-type N-terminal cleavage/methylation domain-containing protein [Leptothoe sp. PORK10 BA2]